MVMANVVQKLGQVTVALLCVLVLLACALALPAAAPQRAVAAGSLDAQQGDMTLTVYYERAAGFVTNADVRVYRVADIQPDGTLISTQEFAGYPVNWSVSDASSAQALANTLKAYIAADSSSASSASAVSAATYSRLARSGGGVAPADEGVTDANGVVVFPCAADALEPGYYLVTAASASEEGEFVEALPVLLALPYEYESGEVDENPGVELKVRSFSLSRSIDLDVSKIWEGDSAAVANRPSEVTVELLRDGQLYDSAVLNAANGWHAAWDDLEAGHEWDVVERNVADGYTVAIYEDGNSISMVNTWAEESEEPDSPDAPGDGDDGDGSDGSGDFGGSSSGKNERLPQTGMLWWPVPLLLAAGVCLVTVGRVRG